MNVPILDLFCGAGGFSTGFLQAGFNVKYAIDNNPKVRETFEYNHPNTEFILSSVQDQDPHDFKDKIKGLIGSLSSQYKLVGNSIPVLMSYHLAKAIKEKIDGKI